MNHEKNVNSKISLKFLFKLFLRSTENKRSKAWIFVSHSMILTHFLLVIFNIADFVKVNHNKNSKYIMVTYIFKNIFNKSDFSLVISYRYKN